MKNNILLLIVFFMSLGVFAQEQKPAQNNNQNILLKSQTDSLQYALGAYLGQWMVQNNFEVQNAKLFLLGMDDVLLNKSLLVNDSVITPLVSAHQLTKQYQKSQLMEKQLFESLKGKAGVGVLPSGVNYIVIEKGTENRPNISDTIIFHAKGIFPGGKVFEDTYEKGVPITNLISNLIPGLNEAIQLMPVGSTWRIFIPSSLAYGSAGIPNQVPAYTALVFDIKLLNIKKNKNRNTKSNRN